jgi:hypothetical protein
MRTKRGHTSSATGGSDHTNFLGGRKPKKWGRSRPIWCFFLCHFPILVSFIYSFFPDLCASQVEEDAEDEAEGGNSYLLHLLRPNSHRAHRRRFLVGLERPRHHFGHGIVCKSGVAPAQHGVLPASKLIVAPGATSCSLGTCATAKVTARVTDMVICVFHAPITLPGRNGNRGSLK